MDIGIIGMGVVGSAIAEGFQQIGHNVISFDIKNTNTKLDDLLDCRIIYVCVPTPSADDGSCDIRNVSNVINQLYQINYSGLIAIKSTVTPGTTQKLIDQYASLRLCFVPEFLRERSAVSDFVDYHDVLIVGTTNLDDYNLIVQCHGSIPKKSTMIDPTAAELSKYFSNVFNSLRIVFANGMYEVCKKLEINYQDVFSAVSNKSTVGKDYLKCDKHYRGYSGACLPKDTLAFLQLTKNLGLDHLKLFSAIIEDNQYYTK